MCASVFHLMWQVQFHKVSSGGMGLNALSHNDTKRDYRKKYGFFLFLSELQLIGIIFKRRGIICASMN